jgi:hypothetical protein
MSTEYMRATSEAEREALAHKQRAPFQTLANGSYDDGEAGRDADGSPRRVVGGRRARAASHGVLR